MQKIQVFLREDQKTALKSLSARTGLRQSDLIRQGVDLLIEGASRRTPDWREATRAAAGVWRDRADLAAINEELRASVRPVRPNWRAFLDEPRADADFLNERPDLIEQGRFSLTEDKPDR
jgi:hypothetical protein